MMGFDSGPDGGVSHAGADLQHMRAQRILVPLHQMIGIVLHKGGSAVSVFTHGFQDSGHGGDFPVALAAVAVALGHQVLRGKPRQLLHAVEILEGVCKGLAALPVQHLLHGDFFSGLVADGGNVIGSNVVGGLVGIHQSIDLFLGDGVHLLHQVANGPGVYLPAQLDLNLYLVALGDGDLAHIVPKTHDLQGFGERHAHGGFHPVAQTLKAPFILPVARNDLPGHTQPGGDEAVFPVTVGSLVQVHEVHIDFFIGDLQIVLGGEVAIGLLQIHKAVDPHLGGREGVAPGDDTGAGIVVIGLLHNVRNLGIGHGRDLINQRIGQALAHFLGHFLGPLCHGFQNLRPIKGLRADNKPKFVVIQIWTLLNYC